MRGAAMPVIKMKANVPIRPEQKAESAAAEPVVRAFQRILAHGESGVSFFVPI